MIKKPYYRIYRPNKLNNSDYILDDEYCQERLDLIKYYNFLQKQVVEIFDYIELHEHNLTTFSAKNYQILGNICMEVENNLKGIISSNSYDKKIKDLNMNDYKKLNQYLKLSDYKVSLRFCKDQLVFQPFENIDRSLEWYQSYNSIKHNRTKDMKQATLENVLKALGGLSILLRTQFCWYYDIVNNQETLLNVLQLQNGVFNSQNTLSIFEIIEEPKWNDDEYYNFDWNTLKNEKEKFTKLEIKLL